MKRGLFPSLLAVRYAYIDVPVTAVLRRSFRRGITDANQSFDIACHWAPKYAARIASGDCRLMTEEEIKEHNLTFTVPSMHIRGHAANCSDIFGFKYMVNSGRSHGEGVETMWAAFNWLQEICRASGFGARRDLLTDQFLHWNREKILHMGEGKELLNPGQPWAHLRICVPSSCSDV